MPAVEDRRRLTPERRAYLIAALAALAAFAVVAALMKLGAFDHLDARMVTYFATRRHQPWLGVADTLDHLGAWWLYALVAAALVVGLWLSGRMVQAVYLALTILVAVTVNPLLKLAFARPRPVDQAVTTISDRSFPSGHTTSATAIAAALVVIAWPTRWRWPVLAAGVLFPLVMAWSRLYLGVHWPSDVLASLALGSAMALAVRGLTPWPSPEEAAVAQGRADERARAAGGANGRLGASGGDVSRNGKTGAAGQARPGIDVVFLDWGNTLMVDNGMREGPMKDWDAVEAEAGAQEALQRLRARYRLVVATNAADSPAYFVRLALARVGLDDYIDDVVSSADVGDHKPNYAFFRAALLREGDRGVPLDPRRAVMVGDGTTNDIAGGQRAGMHTIWYNPTRRRFPEGAPPPDAVIKRLSDLPATVDRIAGLEPRRQSRRRRKAEAEAAAAAVAAARNAADAAAAAVRDLRAETAAEDAAAEASLTAPGGATPVGPPGLQTDDLAASGPNATRS